MIVHAGIKNQTKRFGQLPQGYAIIRIPNANVDKRITFISAKIRKILRTLLDWIVRTNTKLGLEDRAETFVRLLENHFPKASRVLDLGGGWGFYDAPLRKRGHRVTVVDVVRPGYQKAPVVLYDGRKIPFADKSFDVTLLVTVLHHVDDLDEVVREACRVTRHKLIVIEDLYRHRLGKTWTILRDRIYNLEFWGHPCRFKTKAQWINYFAGHGCRLSFESEIYTWLMGLRILNGLMVFEPPESRDSMATESASGRFLEKGLSGVMTNTDESLLPYKVIWIEERKGIRTGGKVPDDLELFQDHFPDFPVVPGVLSLEILREAGCEYLRTYRKAAPSKISFKEVGAVKFTNYLRPGSVWESELTLLTEDEGQSRWRAKLQTEGKNAVSAEFVLAEDEDRNR